MPRASYAANDDIDLAAAIGRGDDVIVERFVREHSGWMLAVSQRIVMDRAIAQDCVQDAFLSAFQKIHTFEGRSTLKSWIRRIIVNASLMKLRSRRRFDEQSIDDLLPEFNADFCRIEEPWQKMEQPDALLEKRQTANLIRSKINELPDNYRIVLVLRDIEELSTKEVAELLLLNQGTVKVRLHRARAALKKLLEPSLRGSI